MRLTDTQCEKLRDAILDIYPIQNKADLESFLRDSLKINLEYIVDSSKSSIETINKIIHKDNHQQRNESIKILILRIPAKDLDLNKEIYGIETAIERAKKRFLLNFTTKIVYSTDDIRRNIAEENPQIVHICGHGLENGYLKLENDDSGISPEVLKLICQQHKHTIKCVLLNACHSEKATLEISQHINYAIGMNNEIIDNVAIEFAKGFYDGLGYSNEHNTYVTAFNEGIIAVIAKNKSQESIPVLKTRISYEEAIHDLLQKLDAENKINELIEELKNLYSTNNLLTKFISYYKHPLKDYLSEFEEIFQKITDSSAIASASQCIFPDNPPDKTKIISALVTNDYNRNPSPLSIIKFANRLAAILEKKENKNENPQSPYIRDWLAKISNRLGIEIFASDENESNQQAVKTYLLIKVDNEGSQLRLQAEVMKKRNNCLNSEPLDLPGCSDEKGIICDSFENIPSKLDEYIEYYYETNNLLDTILEIFLPMQHIDKNIYYDWLHHHPDSITCILLRENKIRIHLSERTRKNFSFSLKLRCRTCKDRISREYSNNDYLPEEEISKIYKKVYKENLNSIVEELQKKIGVKFYHKNNQEQHFLKAVLIAGIPLVFWTRDSTPQKMNLDLDRINCLLKIDCLDNNFEEIIEHMHNFIRKANTKEKPEEHFGYHLGFLCDYPLDIPKNSILQLSK